MQWRGYVVDKYKVSGLVAVSDPNLEGTSATLVLRFKNLKQDLTIC